MLEHRQSKQPKLAEHRRRRIEEHRRRKKAASRVAGSAIVE
jgi:hypothetical protein